MDIRRVGSILIAALIASLSAAANGQVPSPPATPAAPNPITQQPAPPAPPPIQASSTADPQITISGQPAADVNSASEKSASPDAGATSVATSAKDPVIREGEFSEGDFSIHSVGGEIREDQLRQLLVGKPLYLRAGYLDNNLQFDEHGRLLSHSPQGSYTLSQIQINKVKLSKKKMELVGDRYALHFLGAAAYDDPNTATDRVKITPKKRAVRISFDREEVEKPKDKDKKKKHKHHAKNADLGKETSGATTPPVPANEADTQTAISQIAPSNNQAHDRQAQDRQAPDRQPQDRQNDKKRTTTSSAAHSSQMLLAALNNTFSVGVDARMIAAMPDFWKLYYDAAQAKTDYKPTDPGVFRQSAVDQKAKLISSIDPPSNEFAQANGVAGIALYHAVVGSNGKVEEVVAGRPIGFGLDESAEQTIRKASFQPALKDGKPVPVALDLVVSFRIYSKRTSQPVAVAQAGAEKPKETILPGPYTSRVQAQMQAETAQPPAPQPSAAPQPPATQAPSAPQ